MKRFQTITTVASLLILAAIAIIKVQSDLLSTDNKFVAGDYRILPTSSDQVDLLGLFLTPDAIVGIPEQALEYSRIAMMDPRYKKIPTYERFVTETALQWDPNLVLISPFVAPDTRFQLEKYGISLLSLGKRANWKDLKSSIQKLGKVLGKRGLADSLIAKHEARLESLDAIVEAQAKPTDENRVLSYANYGTGGWGAGVGLSIDSVIKRAGLKNAALELNRPGAFAMSFEDLIQLDPDYIIVVEGKNGEPSSTEQTLINHEQTASLRAVKNGRLLRLPASLLSASSQEMITAAEELHQIWRAAEAKRAQN